MTLALDSWNKEAQSLSQQNFDLKSSVSSNRLVGLWRMLSGFRGLYFAAIFALALAAMAKTGTLLLLQYLIDDVLLRDHILDALLLIALSFIVMAGVEGVFTYLSGRWSAQTAEGIVLRLRNYLFDHLQRLTFTFHSKNSTGELIQRVTSDVNHIQRFYSEQAIGLGRILLLFSINFTALLALNWQLALFSVIVVPFIGAVSMYFFQRVSKAYERYQEQEGKLSATLQENLTGVRVVKAFARQDYERDKFETENWEHFQRGKVFMKGHALYWPITDIMSGLQQLSGYVVGAIMVMDGTMSIGTYIAYIGLIIWIIEPMRGLGRIIVNASEGLVSYERVAKILKEDREPITDGLAKLDQPLKGDIAFENVTFEYEPGQAVLKDISFTVKAGTSVALLGSTGSGKTSLVNLLPRFYDYTSGRVTVDGVPLSLISRQFLRANIGIVEQEPFLFSRSIRENITYGVGRHVDEAEVIAAAKAADVHEVITAFPEGYDTIVGERGVTLSGGQKQRVAIARTLLKNPRILILDDSTSSVDTETEANIRAALDELMEARTTFIIAHRIQSIMNADQILVLDKGRIVQRGTHETLVNQPGIYQQIYDLQVRIETELEKELANV
ncbi:MAG: ABC transporter ATP-binding protein [Anaerolinea sp.]|nr:ABC transporter ATP-binding protein [Anaerolinea sp.]